MISPSLGVYIPVRQLKNVVLPAPLGPMIAAIMRGSRAKSTFCTAVRPPNLLTTPLASSNIGGLPGGDDGFFFGGREFLVGQRVLAKLGRQFHLTSAGGEQ